MAIRERISPYEAVERLERIAELEDWGEELLLRPEAMVAESTAQLQTILWLEEHDAEQAHSMIANLLRVVLDYLNRAAYRTLDPVEKQRAFRGIVSVMTTVGEAAQKLDRFAASFYGAKPGFVTRLPQYRELQEFYLSQIAEPVAEVVDQMLDGVEPYDLGAMDDIERVRADRDYELFYLRQPNGRGFVSPTMEKSIKLAADFGSQLEEYKGADPLVWVQLWHDEMQQRVAAEILGAAARFSQQFYMGRITQAHTKLSNLLDRSLTALKLSAAKDNLLIHGSKKGCYEYFADFQAFIGSALQSREYSDLCTVEPDRDGWEWTMRELTHVLCYALYTHRFGCQEVLNVVRGLMHDGVTSQNYWEVAGEQGQKTPIAHRLDVERLALSETLKAHPNGPIFKVIDLLREVEVQPFNLLAMGNLPGRLFRLGETDFLRLPAPIEQEVVDEVRVVDEFRAFLRHGTYKGHKRSHFLVNLVDRNHPIDGPRAAALERLVENPELAHLLTVVTLATDGPFYHQTGEFANATMEIGRFFDLFEEQLHNEKSYWFPEFARQALFPAFGRKGMEVIGALFFPGCEELTRGQRQTFIDLFHLFLTWKLLELSQPDSFSYTCKDGVDIGMTMSASLFLATKILNNEAISADEFESIRGMLNIPALLYRERALDRVCHGRMVQTVAMLETTMHRLSSEGRRDDLQCALDSLFHTPLPNAN